MYKLYITKLQKNNIEEPEIYKYDVLYLIELLTTKDEANEFNPKKNTGNVYEREKEVHKSRLFRIIATKIYKKINFFWKKNNKKVKRQF